MFLQSRAPAGPENRADNCVSPEVRNSKGVNLQRLDVTLWGGMCSL
jgi:hypothetical protein